MSKSKYTRELLEEAVSASVSIAGVLRYLHLTWAGGTHAHISRRIKRAEPLRKETAHRLRRAMIESGISYECQACRCDGIWMASELRLEIDHINGDPFDNRRENLRFLCPNCHAQTATYCVRNRGR